MIGSISFGIAFVCGKKRVPKPAAQIIAFVGCFILHYLRLLDQI
jgi:hypothetical protein